MNILNKVGVGVFLLGLVVMIAYSVYPLFNTAVEEGTILAILLVTMSSERYKEWKKMKEEIDEKELRP